MIRGAMPSPRLKPISFFSIGSSGSTGQAEQRERKGQDADNDRKPVFAQISLRGGHCGRLHCNFRHVIPGRHGTQKRQKSMPLMKARPANHSILQNSFLRNGRRMNLLRKMSRHA
jgi:hypothetical protein